MLAIENTCSGDMAHLEMAKRRAKCCAPDGDNQAAAAVRDRPRAERSQSSRRPARGPIARGAPARAGCRRARHSSRPRSASAARARLQRISSASTQSATSGSACTACKPTKCDTRRSPCSVLQPVPGKPGTAVRRADRVGTHNRHVLSGARVRQLRRRRPGHQPAAQRADDGDASCQAAVPIRARDRQIGCRHNATATATVVSVCTTMASPMTVKSTPSKDRADVEVARRSAPRLQIDDHELEHQRDRGRPADDAARPEPVRDEREDPGQREGSRSRSTRRTSPASARPARR